MSVSTVAVSIYRKTGTTVGQTTLELSFAENNLYDLSSSAVTTKQTNTFHLNSAKNVADSCSNGRSSLSSCFQFFVLCQGESAVT